MERMWVQEAKHKYPKQWIVAVNLEWEPKNKLIGDIFMVTPDEDEAYDKLMELDESGEMGEVMVKRGYDDTPQIGGLTICSQ
ncbi:MAG: hypothetical protein LBI54_02965 [Lachnospiraceae bacterium]|nr:hypothetical protein [Lachnospiraceae bacterium]